ncbi:MAG: DUF3880 domain-containing protein [Lachnospira sp.]
MRILLYKWNVFNQEDAKSAIEYFGHEVTLYEEPVVRTCEETGYRDYDLVALKSILSEYQCAFSFNYFSHLSEVCQSLNIPYISWTVDSPLITLYNKSVYNDCNYIFIFDKYYYYELLGLGVKNVYYMPLAVNTQRLDRLFLNSHEGDLIKYDSDISFVGSMYHRNSYDRFKTHLPPYLKGYFDGAMRAQMEVYGDNFLDDILSVEVLEQLIPLVDFVQDEESFSNLRLVFSSTFLGFKLANIERVELLNMLASEYRVDLYTEEPDDELVGINYKGYVGYMNEMPKVFNRSKINLNITLRNIRTGIPLRVWDILGAGGFLMTNFQAELPEYFENGRNIVYFDSHKDCLRKCEYYLNHEEERREIAMNGYKLVKEKHSYIDRIGRIFDIVGIKS